MKSNACCKVFLDKNSEIIIGMTRLLDPSTKNLHKICPDHEYIGTCLLESQTMHTKFLVRQSQESCKIQYKSKEKELARYNMNILLGSCKILYKYY